MFRSIGNKILDSESWRINLLLSSLTETEGERRNGGGGRQRTLLTSWNL